MASLEDELLDDDDWRYTRSFAADALDSPEAEAEADAFVRRHGFLVVRDVLSPAECKATRSDMWDVIEAEAGGAVSRRDKGSWHLWASRNFGMPASTAPVFAPQFVRNRANPRLRAAFAAVLGTRELLVSHDRFALYRPTEAHPELRTPTNLHLDMNPWRFKANDPEVRARVDGLRYERTTDFVVENNLVTEAVDGCGAQGVINLLDNVADDGGLQLVPGFAGRFDEWLAAMGPMPAEWAAPGSFRFAPGAEHGVRITMRAGSVCVWDQRTAHGAVGNRSARPRAIQFVRFLRADSLTPERAEARACAVQRELRAAGMLGEVGGAEVFGLGCLPRGVAVAGAAGGP